MKKLFSGIFITFIAILSVFCLITTLIVVYADENGRLIGILISFAVMIAVTIVALLIIGKSLKKLSVNRLKHVKQDLEAVENERFVSENPYTGDSILGPVISDIEDLTSNLDNRLYNYRQEKYKLDYVLKNINQGVVALDYDGNIVFSNRWFTRLVGTDENSTSERFLDNVSDDMLANKLALLLDGKQNAIINHVVSGRNVMFKLIYVNNIGIKFIILMLDVTLETEGERLRKEFIVNATKELGNPIAKALEHSVKLLGELDSGDADKAKEEAQKLIFWTKKMQSILSDTEYLSKIDSGLDPDDKCELSLAEVTRELNERYSNEISEKGIEVTVTGDGRINASKTYVYQLLTNLFVNAVQYNKQNGKIDVKITDDNNGRVEYKIADNGVGISESNINRVFERFYVVGSSDKSSSSGLGLAIVKHICLNLHAAVNVESKLNKGSTFTISFGK